VFLGVCPDLVGRGGSWYPCVEFVLGDVGGLDSLAAGYGESALRSSLLFWLRKEVRLSPLSEDGENGCGESALCSWL